MRIWIFFLFVHHFHRFFIHSMLNFHPPPTKKHSYRSQFSYTLHPCLNTIIIFMKLFYLIFESRIVYFMNIEHWSDTAWFTLTGCMNRWYSDMRTLFNLAIFIRRFLEIRNCSIFFFGSEMILWRVKIVFPL